MTPEQEKQRHAYLKGLVETEPRIIDRVAYVYKHGGGFDADLYDLILERDDFLALLEM